MAKFASIFTVLFYFVACASARTQFDLQGNDVAGRDPSILLPESDTKQTLLLPSEKQPKSESTTVFEFEPQTAETKPLEVGTTEDLPISDAQEVDAVPLKRPMATVIFRPVNRHFRSKFPFRFHIPLRGCHHGIKPIMKPTISYGNDMILAGESKYSDPEMFRGGVRQIPARWVRLHHHHHHHDEGMPRFPFGRHHHMFAKHSFRRPFRREEAEEEEEGKHMKGRVEREEGSFLTRFRKFLNHF